MTSTSNPITTTLLSETTTETELFLDIGYLIKYPILMLSIFGLVTSIIHSYFLTRILKTYPLSICLFVISISDLIIFFTRFIAETVTIVTYVDHRNCIGYVNRLDLVYRMITEGFYFLGDYVGGWMVVVTCIVQIVDFKKVGKNVWNCKLSIIISILTICLNTLSIIIQYISYYFLIKELPYSECDKTNLMALYMEGNHNWVTSFVHASKMFVSDTNDAEMILRIIFCFYMPWSIFKSKETQKKRNGKLIFWLLITNVVAFTLNMSFHASFLNFGTDWEYDDNYQEDVAIPQEVARLLVVISALFRPFLTLILCSEYQATVKSFFIVDAFVPRASIAHSDSSYISHRE